MKKQFYLTALFVCSTLTITIAQSWNSGSIKGEGEVVKKEITLTAIDGFDLGISGDVVLMQGSQQKIVVEGQQNIIDNIRTDVRGGSWNISFEKNVKDAKGLTIYITLPTIEDIGLSGSGNITGKNKFSGIKDLDISVSGSGNVRFETDAEEIDLSLSGSGNVDLGGTVGSFEISISGSGNVHAASLVSKGCEIAISGSGDVQVKVNGPLEVAISGSGNVKYAGDTQVTAKVSGSGEVSRI